MILLLFRGDGEGGSVVAADGVGEGGGEPLVALVVGGVALVVVAVVGGAVPWSGGVIVERGVTSLRLTMRRCRYVPDEAAAQLLSISVRTVGSNRFTTAALITDCTTLI